MLMFNEYHFEDFAFIISKHFFVPIIVNYSSKSGLDLDVKHCYIRYMVVRKLLVIIQNTCTYKQY